MRTQHMNSLLHQHTESIVSAAIHAVLPDVAVVRALQGYRFGTGKIVLVAAGKAAWQMANAASDCLGDRIADGVVVTKYGHIKGSIAHIRCFEGGHPVPDDGSCQGTQAALDLVQGLTAQDTVGHKPVRLQSYPAGHPEHRSGQRTAPVPGRTP